MVVVQLSPRRTKTTREWTHHVCRATLQVEDGLQQNTRCASKAGDDPYSNSGVLGEDEEEEMASEKRKRFARGGNTHDGFLFPPRVTSILLTESLIRFAGGSGRGGVLENEPSFDQRHMYRGLTFPK